MAEEITTKSKYRWLWLLLAVPVGYVADKLFEGEIQAAFAIWRGNDPLPIRLIDFLKHIAWQSIIPSLAMSYIVLVKTNLPLAFAVFVFTFFAFIKVSQLTAKVAQLIFTRRQGVPQFQLESSAKSRQMLKIRYAPNVEHYIFSTSNDLYVHDDTGDKSATYRTFRVGIRFDGLPGSVARVRLVIEACEQSPQPIGCFFERSLCPTHNPGNEEIEIKCGEIGYIDILMAKICPTHNQVQSFWFLYADEKINKPITTDYIEVTLRAEASGLVDRAVFIIDKKLPDEVDERGHLSASTILDVRRI